MSNYIRDKTRDGVGEMQTNEKNWFDKQPTVAGRPAWISKLTEEEADRFNEAVQHVQSKL